jgi:dTDP-4-dehydrorhamnose 3,5-epimerase
MRIQVTKLKEVLLIKPDVFEDFRGKYVEIYNHREYCKLRDIFPQFVQDDISTSTKGILRGLHGDNTTWKLVSCLHGRLYQVVINNIQGDEEYGKWESFTISGENHWQILIPPGFANGHLVLSDKAVFHYKQSTYYNPQGQFTIKWNDPRFNIWWPIKNPVLSIRDETGVMA